MSNRLISKIRTIEHFASDQGGATLLTFGLFLTLLLGGMGVGMDISMAKRTQTQAQEAADHIAQQAAEFWMQNNRRPGADDEGMFAHNVVYLARNAGLDFGTTAEDDVKLKVSYSGGRRVQVKIWGASRTTLSAAFGYDEIDFEVKSIASIESI